MLIVPILGMITFLVEGIYIIALDVIRTSRHLTPHESRLYGYSIDLSLTVDLAVNVLVTLMIVFKLWRVGRRSLPMTAAGGSKHPYRAIIVALIESGLIHTVVMTVYVAIRYLDSVSGCSVY